MNITVENKNIPLFYHVPRCAGTYILQIIYELVRIYMYSQSSNNHRIIFNIKKDNYLCFRIIGFSDRIDKDHYNVSLEYENINKLKNLNIFAIFVEARGFALQNQFLEKFDKFNFKSFMPLRDPYERTRSLYYYLNSDKSNHEPTHGRFKTLDFQNYLASDYISSNWLTVNMLNLPENSIITEKEYQSMIKILDNITLYPFEDLKTVIDKIFLECWGVSSSQIHPQALKIFDKYKNISNQNMISLSEIPEDIKNRFLSKMYWDYKLYNHYIKMLKEGVEPTLLTETDPKSVASASFAI